MVPKAQTAANLVCSGSKSPEQAEVHAKPSGLKQSPDDADEAPQYAEVEGWFVKGNDDADEAPQYAKVEGWGVKRNDDADESKEYYVVEGPGASEDFDDTSAQHKAQHWDRWQAD